MKERKHRMKKINNYKNFLLTLVNKRNIEMSFFLIFENIASPKALLTLINFILNDGDINIINLVRAAEDR